jgi:Fe-S-cluster containining protein
MAAARKKPATRRSPSAEDPAAAPHRPTRKTQGKPARPAPVSTTPRPFFNCDKCPSYCCSYELIQVTDADVRRLAKHFALDEPTARRRFVHQVDGEPSLRHQKDEHYGTVCQFLDLESRRCTVYHARPRICRDFPGTARCGYYDFLMSERRSQEDPEFVSRAYNPPK